ncbi:1-aminocyclopropane-1-carboxylate oxidase-like 1 [Melia azedarach]|uniref:1-aminocyclopropane-1-carboxylate oxidase-like 1 n=1 Tax=Melia azedarach TaxID=155640 RepID=A0ACC1YI91_MELAZ|nr:1-aminocyclopropane-1-carboxylate oxidase-like 1 [Melia azedarach]
MEIRNCDRISELKAFDDTKAGVKGLVDVGVTKVPKIFILEDHQKLKLDDMPICCDPYIKIPIIDLEGIKNDAGLRSEIIDKVRDASEKWGFFQVINHGISTSILDETIDGARRFFDQELEIKKEYYSRDYSKRVLYLSNYTLYQAQAASWSDTLSCFMGRNLASAEELPAACRDILITYNKEVLKLGSTLLEVLSEALGLVPNYLNDMGCGDEINISCHYYPACPEPELTMGIRAHADSGFLTILLQNQIGGLQVLHESKWFDVVPTPGAFVVNLGYLMQLISNDQFKSVYHRVLSKNEGPRISIASCFISRSSTPFGPIKELVSEGNPAVYSEITAQDVVKQQFSKVKKGLSTLDNFKLPSHSA